MRFSEWLFSEASLGGGDPGSAWFFGNYLLPSDAFDWAQAASEPAELKFVDARWKLEKEQGRKFLNLDLPKVNRQKFVSVYSNTMPDGSEEGWKHRPDGRPNLKIDHDAKYELQGIRHSASVSAVLGTSNPDIDRKAELNRLFGQFEPKYYEIPKDFDQPWVHKGSGK